MLRNDYIDYDECYMRPYKHIDKCKNNVLFCPYVGGSRGKYFILGLFSDDEERKYYYKDLRKYLIYGDIDLYELTLGPRLSSENGLYINGNCCMVLNYNKYNIDKPDYLYKYYIKIFKCTMEYLQNTTFDVFLYYGHGSSIMFGSWLNYKVPYIPAPVFSKIVSQYNVKFRLTILEGCHMGSLILFIELYKITDYIIASVSYYCLRSVMTIPDILKLYCEYDYIKLIKEHFKKYTPKYHVLILIKTKKISKLIEFMKTDKFDLSKDINWKYKSSIYDSNVYYINTENLKLKKLIDNIMIYKTKDQENINISIDKHIWMDNKYIVMKTKYFKILNKKNRDFYMKKEYK